MNPRARFVLIFLGYCFVATIVLASTVLLFPSRPQLGRAILVEWVAILAGGGLLFYRLRKRLPPPRTVQNEKAARIAQRIGWFYLGALVVGLLVRGKEILWGLPHGLGFVLPLIPLVLGVYYLRLSNRLKSSVDGDGASPTA